MVLTRRQEAAQQGLYQGLCSRDADAVLRALASLGGLPPLAGGCSPLHLAAATDCVGALAALAAAGGRGALDAPLGRLLFYEWPDWMDQLWGEALSHEQRMALGLPGCTPLAVACRLGHVQAVRALLALGASPCAVGDPVDGLPKPYTALSAAVLTSGEAPTVRAIVAALLEAGADPLAHSVRRRCSVLRCACGSEFLPNGSLPLLLDHLEGRAASGQLSFGSGDAAADVMIAAARCGRVRLFRLAHEYALAASGRRRAAAGGGGGARPSRPHPARALDLSDSEEEGGGGAASPDSSVYSEDAGAGAAGPGGEEAGLMAWLFGRLARGGGAAAAASWQPTELQLFEVLRSAALGGSPPILRCILASPLPFSLRATDASGNGLLAHCAAHAAPEPACTEALALLAGAGARLTLKRLLYVIEKRPCGLVVEALLAHERPAVTTDDATLKAASVVSFTCPIHRLLHAWNRGSHVLASSDPPTWEREVMRVLEALLAAGYRPTVYTQLRRPLHMMGPAGMAPAPLPFDPFDVLPVHTDADRRLVHVAKQRGWDAQHHAIWPEPFKQALRTLLLCAHRLSRGGEACGGRPGRAERAARRAGGGGQAGASLGALPLDLLLQVAQRAAFPVSAWM